MKQVGILTFETSGQVRPLRNNSEEVVLEEAATGKNIE